jgi:hypothetical protein
MVSSLTACLQEVRKGGGGKGKKGGKGKAGADAAAASSVRLKPCPSFFRFFTPDSSSKGSKAPKHLHDPTALHDDDDDDDEVGQCLDYTDGRHGFSCLLLMKCACQRRPLLCCRLAG